MTLELSGLSKSFNGQVAVDDINLKVPAGSMYGFLGGNGAGKTTTFRMILGLLQPSSGSITYNDRKSTITLRMKSDTFPKNGGCTRN